MRRRCLIVISLSLRGKAQEVEGLRLEIACRGKEGTFGVEEMCCNLILMVLLVTLLPTFVHSP
jgi:hypothetical protein